MLKISPAHDFPHILDLDFRFILNMGNKKAMRYWYIFIWFLLIYSCGGQREKIYPQQTVLTASVYASVSVQPDSLYQVYAAVGGILDRNVVEEGDLVKKGDALAEIINSTPKLNTENARLALLLAQENYSGNAAILTGLEDEVRAARLTLTNDSVSYFRQKRLWDQQIGSKADFDNRKLAYELSQNKLNLLLSRYATSKNELQTQLRQARNNYRSAAINTKDFTVTSKINGKVYGLYKELGEIVSTMEPIAVVGSDSIFVIEMLVDEVDIVKLAIGQKALITLDAYGNEIFEAKLSKIYPKKDERSQTFKVEATFENPPKTLYPGLAGEGNIIISEKKEALTIPREYLLDNNRVLTAKGPVAITIGLQNLEQVEILEGIDENTAILKPEE